MAAIPEKARKKSRDKPGGSNKGKYPIVGKFCGPAGGAPKGTYPVNTRKRAIAALAYARHAPNPAGIRRCVCRHYPNLPACKKKKDFSDNDIIMELFIMYKDKMISNSDIVSIIMNLCEDADISERRIVDILTFVSKEHINRALALLLKSLSA